MDLCRCTPAFIRIAFLAFAALLPLVSARADVLVTTDGRTLYGEVVEESRTQVRFRCEIADIWSTITVSWSQIYSLDLEEGDQSDLAREQSESPQDVAGEIDPWVEDDTSSTEGGEAARSGPIVAVIPLKGSVGLIDDDDVKMFDRALLQSCFEKAESMGASIVVLDIESPGGLVSEMEAICELIVEWHDRMRIIAWPHEAYSAAAIIALTCRDLVVHPDARIGAAVIIQSSGRGVSAVDAKFASPHHAKQRQYMAASGQPYELVAAMTTLEAELWWSPVGGFKATLPAEAANWDQLDRADTILTMTGDEAMRWGVALTSAADLNMLVDELSVSSAAIIRMDDEVERYQRVLDRRLSELKRSFEDYFRGLVQMIEGLKGIPDAAKRGDRTLAKQHQDTVNRGRALALASSSRIERTDRALLRRGDSLPGVVLDRLAEDRKLIGKIDDLIRSGKIDQFNDAVERINAVIEGWRTLLNER